MGTIIVETIGFIVALAFVLFGMDDLLWDIYALFRRIKGVHVDLSALDSKAPRMLAIVIAAWHEDAVIGDVVRNLVKSTNYPQDMYRVFLAVYPNDPATIAVADELAVSYPCVVKLTNVHGGPTSKADNLNHALKQIIAYEKANHIRFAGITIHDSEDVVHPLELKMTNYLIDDYDALQFPVFPLMRMPRFSNFFKTLTTGTYADEFADHHYRTMVMRDRLGFVPSAGTGFCLRRSFLDVYGDGEGTIMPEDSLTEDYKLSLSMNMAGYRVHYVLERVPRVDQTGREFWDYIATRSMFPQSFKLAVRQKTRWVYGITMQSASLRDIFSKSALNFRERTFLYKDLKAKFANFVLLPGYMVFIYFLVTLFVPQLPIMYPYLSPGWWLCIFLTFMMVERQFLRGKAIVNVYGKRMMFFACLLPPLFPIRLIWGNIINICATTRAWAQKAAFNRLARKSRAQIESEEREAAAAAEDAGKLPDPTGEVRRDAPAEGHAKPSWAKTDHEFLPEDVLVRYRRRYGDFLLTGASLDEDELKDILAKDNPEGLPLGERLLLDGAVTEDDLANATAAQNNTVHVRLTPALQTAMGRWAGTDIYEKTSACPLLLTKEGYLAVASDRSDSQTVRRFEDAMGKPVFLLIAASSELESAAQSLAQAAALDDGATVSGDGSDDPFDELHRLCDEGAITLSQAGIALGYAVDLGSDVRSVLHNMGLAVGYEAKPRSAARIMEVRSDAEAVLDAGMKAS